MATVTPTPAAHPALSLLLPSSLSSSHHPLRITSQAKLENVVAYSLSHLAASSSSPIVFHSLPAAPSAPILLPKGPITSTPLFDAIPPPAPLPNIQKAAETSIAAIPKLVSVVEIVKREWFRVPLPAPTPAEADPSVAAEARAPSLSLAEPSKDDGPTREEGLHQYTLLTTLEALKLADPGRKTERDLEDDELELEQAELVKMEWLKGGAGRKKRPRKHHSPCMIVVLSATSLPSLSPSTGWTYQPPSPPPRSKPAKRPSAAVTDDGADGEVGTGEGIKSKRRRKRKSKAKQGEADKEKAAAEDGKENEGMEVDEAEADVAGGGD